MKYITQSESGLMIFHNYSRPRHYILSFLTILLNLLVLSVFKVPERYIDSLSFQCEHIFLPDSNVHTSHSETVTATNASTNIILEPDTPLWYSPLLYILGILHLILGIFMMVEYCVIIIPLGIEGFVLYHWLMNQV